MTFYWKRTCRSPTWSDRPRCRACSWCQVTPIEPHPLSLMVLRRLFETVVKVRRLNPELRVLGFLPTKVHHSSRLAADMLAALHEEFPDLPLLPSIPLSVKSAESAAERTSVLQYMPRSSVATAYREVGAWLEEHGPDGPRRSPRITATAANVTTTEAAVHV